METLVVIMLVIAAVLAAAIYGIWQLLGKDIEKAAADLLNKGIDRVTALVNKLVGKVVSRADKMEEDTRRRVLGKLKWAQIRINNVFEDAIREIERLDVVRRE